MNAQAENKTESVQENNQQNVPKDITVTYPNTTNSLTFRYAGQKGICRHTGYFMDAQHVPEFFNLAKLAEAKLARFGIKLVEQEVDADEWTTFMSKDTRWHYERASEDNKTCFVYCTVKNFTKCLYDNFSKN